MAGPDITPDMRGKISMSPVYFNGVVFSGVAFDEGRYIGRAMAMDARDGHLLWALEFDSRPWRAGPRNLEQGSEKSLLEDGRSAIFGCRQ